MPRKQPLPKSESDICDRLRRYREAIKCSRLAFAREAAVDAELLKACEYLRSPLRYGLAVPILKAFSINPEWLAIGKYPMSLPIAHIPTSHELGVREKALFSDVFKQHIAPRIAGAIESRLALLKGNLDFGTAFLPDAPGRWCAEAWLNREVAEWIEELPDENLNSFLQKVKSVAGELIKSYPVESLEVRDKRKRELAIVRAGIAVREKLSHLYSTIDISQQSSDAPFVSLTWKNLKHRLILATSERGKKAAAADFAGVDRSNMNRWLDDNQEPGAEAAFRLLEWVTAEEDQKRKSSQGALTPGEPKTQLKGSSDETKPKSGRRKK